MKKIKKLTAVMLTIGILIAAFSFNVFAMQIFVKDPLGKTITLEIEPTDTIYSIKSKIQEKTGVIPKRQTLYYADNQLNEESTISEYNIQRESTLDVRFESQESSPIIFISMDNGMYLTLLIELTDSIDSIKAKVQEKTGLPIEKQTLLFENVSLMEGKTLNDYNVTNNAILLLKANSIYGLDYKSEITTDETSLVTIIADRDVDKIQFYCPADGGTMTFMDGGKFVKSITDNNNGTNTWVIEKSYPVGRYSFELKTKIGRQPYTNEYRNIDFTVVKPKIISGVFFAQATSAYFGEMLTVTAKVNIEATNVRLTFDDDGTITFSKTSSNIVSIIDNNDGTATWTMKVKASFLGTLRVLVQAKTDRVWSKENVFNVDLVVTNRVKDTGVISAEVDEYVMFKDYFTVKATVNTYASNVRLYFTDGSTITFSPTSSLLEGIKNNGDGTVEWTFKIKASFVGTLSAEVQAKTDSVWDKEKTKTITLVSYY